MKDKSTQNKSGTVVSEKSSGRKKGFATMYIKGIKREVGADFDRLCKVLGIGRHEAMCHIMEAFVNKHKPFLEKVEAMKSGHEDEFESRQEFFEGETLAA